MTAMFIGGAAGSIGATLAWERAGWAAVCGFGVILALTALVLQKAGRPVREPGAA
jgi:polyferredoxin